jgi:hypothetical protein
MPHKPIRTHKNGSQKPQKRTKRTHNASRYCEKRETVRRNETPHAHTGKDSGGCERESEGSVGNEAVKSWAIQFLID